MCNVRQNILTITLNCIANVNARGRIMEVNSSFMYSKISLLCSLDIYTRKIKAYVFQISFSHCENEKRKWRWILCG